MKHSKSTSLPCSHDKKKEEENNTKENTSTPKKSKIPLGIDSAGSVSNNPTALSSTHYTDSTAQKKQQKNLCSINSDRGKAKRLTCMHNRRTT